MPKLDPCNTSELTVEQISAICKNICSGMSAQERILLYMKMSSILLEKAAYDAAYHYDGAPTTELILLSAKSDAIADSFAEMFRPTEHMAAANQS